jgi:hypothetical protein
VDAAEVSMFSVRLQTGAETDGAGESDAAEELAAAEKGAVQRAQYAPSAVEFDC